VVAPAGVRTARSLATYHQAGLDALADGLAEDGLGLDADSINGVDDDEGSVSDTKGSSDLTTEVNVTGTVDQVDQVTVSGDLDVLVGLLGISQLLVHGLGILGAHSSGNGNVLGRLSVLEEHTDSGTLDGDTALGLIGTGVGVTGSSGSLGGDNSGLLDKGVRKRSLTVIDVGNHTHGPDVLLQAHDGAHLVDSEINLLRWR